MTGETGTGETGTDQTRTDQTRTGDTDNAGDGGRGTAGAGEQDAVRPLLRIVRGEPDDAELAALTAVVLGIAAAGGDEVATPQPSAWSDRVDQVRKTLPHGPGAWRSSGLPR